MVHIYMSIFCYLLLLGPVVATLGWLLERGGVEVPRWYPFALGLVVDGALTAGLIQVLLLGYAS